ncbi:MAG: glycosyl hydrolase [Bacteroidota bacterium]
MRLLIYTSLLLAFLFSFNNGNAQKKEKNIKDSVKVESFTGLSWRSIGPAFLSGRMADIAVNPKNKSEWVVCVASGHVWKTTNAGTTWKPVFDNYGAYSTGCVRYDPNDANVLWLGSGEGNHQRSLGYGNGVYKSMDGGESWKCMGLKDSRQIGSLLIDPRNSNVVYVACEGSLWGPGGDRGLYKTADGGKTWKKILEISENTGVNNIICDPRNPDVLYATSEQRRRHVWTKIGGGPETALYKSTDAGATWDKMTNGLPSAPMGGIGIAISPVNPDVLYAIIESTAGNSGFFKSENRGATWKKMSDHAAQGQYYNRIFCDPVQFDKVYSLETYSHVTTDGGKTWTRVGLAKRHVDDHSLWIDPADNKHFIIGGDGGLYETWDLGDNYRFVSNLPVTQFYRVQVDNNLPFYNVYGGTQDNATVGGPSSNDKNAVVSDDWYITNGGDGFWVAVDPTDPNIVYCESQYAGMVRYDRKTGQRVEMRPEPNLGEKSDKWNWNTPLIISPHNNKRLYVASTKLFRSDDQGSNWTAISGDLTRGLDRNSFAVMGKYWSLNAVAKDISTSQFGTLVSLDESEKKDGLIYTGADDGLLSITEDGGKNWRQVKTFPGIPEYTYISDILSSRFDENTVYVSFDNILRDDFKPYILKSADKGKTWTSLSAGLPPNGTVHTLQQDFVNPDLLFAGTEFGVFFTLDGGIKWQKLNAGMPDIQVRDLVIQKRECDLVAATFGRGFYIIDDYSALRTYAKDTNKASLIFPVKDARLYLPNDIKGQQGATYYSAENPSFGAVFTYYLKKAPKTLKAVRQQKEDELFKEGKPIPQPTIDDLRKEESETAPYLTFIITDESGLIIRRINTPAQGGMNRISWDLRYSAAWMVNIEKFNPGNTPSGALVLPGNYKVSLNLTVRDTTKEIVSAQSFRVVPLDKNYETGKDALATRSFRRQVDLLGGAMDGTYNMIQTLKKEVSSLQEALQRSNGNNEIQIKAAVPLLMQLDDLAFAFTGKNYGASDEENPPLPVTLWQRMGKISWVSWMNTLPPTGEQKKAFWILQEEFEKVYTATKTILEKDMPALHKSVETLSIPATPLRLPEWKKAE